MQVNHGLTAQLNLQGSGAAAKRYHLGSHLSTIEIGGKFRNAHKFANTLTDNYFPSGTGTPLLLSQFPSKFSNSNYYNGAYKLGPDPSFTDIYNAFSADLAANPGNYTLAQDTSSQFDFIEKVSAGYVMNTIDFNKIRLVAGVRFEGTNLDTATPVFTTDPVTGNPVFSGRSEEHTSELQSQFHLVCRLLLEKKKTIQHLCRCIQLPTQQHGHHRTGKT